MTDCDPVTQQIEQIAREILDQFGSRDLGVVGVIHAATMVIAAMECDATDPAGDLDEILAVLRDAVVEMIENARHREAQDA